jgi:hypothetical protein
MAAGIIEPTVCVGQRVSVVRGKYKGATGSVLAVTPEKARVELSTVTTYLSLSSLKPEVAVDTYVDTYFQSHEYATSSGAWRIADEHLCDGHEPDVYDWAERDMTEAERVAFGAPSGARVRCCCTSCWNCGTSRRDACSEEHMRHATRNLANRHCAHCYCKDCVCDFKRELGIFEPHHSPADAYFDNGCGGQCVLCLHCTDACGGDCVLCRLEKSGCKLC